MADIENLGGALKETLELSNQMEEYIKMAKDCRRHVESARLMAQIAIGHWDPVDAEKLVEWKKVHFKTCLLLKLCDEDKKHQELAKINKINAAAAAAATAKNKAASNARAKSDEVINLEESPLVMTADGSMQKASECVTQPPTETSPRAMKMNKSRGNPRNHFCLSQMHRWPNFSCKSMGFGLGGGRSCMIMVLSWIS